LPLDMGEIELQDPADGVGKAFRSCPTFVTLDPHREGWIVQPAMSGTWAEPPGETCSATMLPLHSASSWMTQGAAELKWGNGLRKSLLIRTFCTTSDRRSSFHLPRKKRDLLLCKAPELHRVEYAFRHSWIQKLKQCLQSVSPPGITASFCSLPALSWHSSAPGSQQLQFPVGVVWRNGVSLNWTT
jgi:hypothetical protein